MIRKSISPPPREDGVCGGGLQHVFRHPGPRLLDHSEDRIGAQVARPADAFHLRGALDDEKLVEEVADKLRPCVGQRLGEGSKLVDRKIIAVSGIDDRDA